MNFETACIVIKSKRKKKNIIFFSLFGMDLLYYPASRGFFAAWLLAYNARSLSRRCYLLMISWLVYPPSRGSK